MNYFDTKANLLYHTQLQPSEIEIMPYYEFEILCRKISDILEKKQKSQEEQEDKYQNKNSSSMMRNARRNSPKTPSVGNIGKGSKPGNFNFPGVPSSLRS